MKVGSKSEWRRQKNSVPPTTVTRPVALRRLCSPPDKRAQGFAGRTMMEQETGAESSHHRQHDEAPSVSLNTLAGGECNGSSSHARGSFGYLRHS